MAKGIFSWNCRITVSPVSYTHLDVYKRQSYYLLGALLGKYNKAEVALPGGCNIGSRPIDQHIKGFKALGADVRIEHGLIITCLLYTSRCV